MPGLVPGIHVFFAVTSQDVDHRDKPGDDDFSGAKQSFVASPGHDDSRRIHRPTN